MSAHAPQIRLRLVDADAVAVRPRAGTASKSPLRSDLGLAGQASQSPSQESALDVGRANLDAARLSALDARWILAVQAYRSLDGGHAAIITPESRQRLMMLGQRVGLRPFESSLVIAVVQDAARAGEDPLGPLAVDRLRLVRTGDATPIFAGARTWRTGAVWTIGTIVLALLIALGAARWLGM